MKNLFYKLVLILSIMQLGDSEVNAQNKLDSMGLTSTAYSAAAYSLRLLSGSYTGPLVRISVGTSYYDVYPSSGAKAFDLTSKISTAQTVISNNLSSAATSASLSSIITTGITNAGVAIWYDQSGYNRFAAVGGGSLPLIISSGSILTYNGKPSLKFNSSSTGGCFLYTPTGAFTALNGTPYTINAVCQSPGGNTGQYNAVVGTSFVGGNNGLSFGYTSNTTLVLDQGMNSISTTIVRNTGLTILTATRTNGSPSSFFLNGNQVGITTFGTSGYLSINTGLFIGTGSTPNSNGWIGNISEVVLFPSDLNTTHGTFETNQSKYYDVPFISSQPSNITQTVCKNGTATPLTVTASANSILTYQWYSNGSYSNSGGTSLGSSNGAQTSSYTPSTTTSGKLYYYCVINSNSGAVTVSNPSVGITVSTSSATSSTETVSACTSYAWHGTTYTASNTTAKWTGTNAASCDSVVTLNLTIKSATSSTETVSACSTYAWHGTTYTASNTTAKWTGTNAAGCDSVVTLNLTIKSPSATRETVSACSSYTWHGTTYTASNTTAKWTGTNLAGCDSVVTLNLTIKSPSATTETISACSTYTWHGTTYTASNTTAKWTGTNLAGCDSVVTLNLTIKSPSATTETISACSTYTWHGTTYTSSNTTAKWTGTNLAGCDSVVTLNLTINSLPTVAITNNTGSTVLNCLRSAISVTATGGSTYSWSNSLGSAAAASINAPGTYTVTATATNGCTATSSIIVTQDITAPTAGITNNTGSTALNCSRTAISVTATGGSTYSWSNSLGSAAAASITAPGTYTVTATATNGCTAASSIVVTQDITAPTVGINNTTGSTVLNCSRSSISVMATGTGALYSWKNSLGSVAGISTGMGSAIITAPGTYMVTATGTNGCTATSSITVTQDITAPTAGITNNTISTILNCSRSLISVTATGGSTYSWSNSLGSAAAASITTPGTYTVTATGTNGCTATSSITVTQDITAPTAGITNNTGSTALNCSRTAISVTATGGSTYSWSNSLGSAATASITTPGTYTVTATGTNGCTATSSITVTQDIAAPTAGITNNTGSTVLNCSRTAISVTATGGSTYSWNNSLGSLAVASITAQGTYTVTVTGTNGCTTTKSITVTQDITGVTAGITNNTGSTVLTCSRTAISVTATGGSTYSWSNSLGSSAAAIISAPGTYSVAVTGDNGCLSTASINVTAQNFATSSTEIISACSSYVWHGVTYTASTNTASWITPNANGCDSVVTLNLTIVKLKPAVPSTLTQTLVSNLCGQRVYRYTLTAVTNATAYTWSLPSSVGGVSGVTVDSGDVNNSRIIRIKYASNTAAFTTDSIKVMSISPCGNSSFKGFKLTNAILYVPGEPTVTVTPIQTNICGARKYRYNASALSTATSQMTAASGWLWSLPEGPVGSTGRIDSGSINSQTIVITYTSNAAASAGDTIRVRFTSDCGLGAIRSTKLTNAILNPPAAPSVTVTTIQTNICGVRKYRYSATALPTANASAGVATGWLWSMPEGPVGSTGSIDSGTVNSQTIVVLYASNAAASAGDTIRVRYTSGCGLGLVNATKLTNTTLYVPAAPFVTVEGVQTNVCGARKYRYTASALSTATTQMGSATGWLWSLPEGPLGSTGSIDSGTINSRTIVVVYTSNAAASSGDSIRVRYTSDCGLGTAKSAPLTYAALNPPLAPSITVTAIQTNICGARKYRYSATGLLTATASAGAATGWLWSMPEGPVGSTGSIDSGTVNSQTIVVLYTSNAAASSGDTIRVRYTSGCGLGSVKATKLTNSILYLPVAPSVVVTGLQTNLCGARKYRYTASALSTATSQIAASNGWLWSLPEGPLGSTGSIDSGAINSQTIVVVYTSNAAASSGDTIRVRFTSDCGLGATKAVALTYGALNPPAAPTTLSGTTSICSIVGTSTTARYTTSAVSGAVTYVWTLPSGAVIDSGSNGLKIKVRFVTASSNDSIYVQAVSSGGCVSNKKVLKLVTTGCAIVPTTKLSIPVSTTEESMRVSVFPNPSTTNFNLQVLTAGKENLTARILDMQGRVIKSLDILPNKIHSVGSQLKPGMYFIEVTNGKDVKTTRVVKY